MLIFFYFEKANEINMNILVLLKLENKQEFILKMAEQISLKGDHHFHFLNIIQSPSQVPLQSDGTIIADCVDYDLTEYYDLQALHLKEITEYAFPFKNKTISELIGHPMRIIEHYTQKNQIDLILSGAHVTTFWEELFTHTFVEQIMERIHVPLLSVKCQRDQLSWEDVVLIRDFKYPKKENLKLIHLLEEMGSKIHFFKINTERDFQTNEIIEKQMDVFADLNQIRRYTKNIFSSKNKEKGTEELTHKFNNHLFALGKVQHHGPFSFLNGDMNSSIVNHIMTPLLIY